MSPHPGEDPLSLAFGIVFAVIGALIAGYITWRMVVELLEKRRLDARTPDPQQFADRPDLQERVDALYLARKVAREALEVGVHDAAERHALLDAFDARVAQAVRHAADAQAGDDAALPRLDAARAGLEATAAGWASGEVAFGFEEE